MRKNILLTIATLVLASLTYIEAQTPDRTERKTFSGISSVDIEQMYGNIVLNETNSKDVILEIHYFDIGKDKATSSVKQSGGQLSIETILPKGKRTNLSDNARIDYILTVPRNIKLDTRLKYGNLRADNVSGAFTANIMYGDLTVTKFTTALPDILMRYGKLKVDQAESLKLSLAYSDVRIDKINTLDFSGNYNDVAISQINTLNIAKSSAYNTYKIRNLNELKSASLTYDNLSIDELGSEVNVSSAYSDIVVGVKALSVKLVNVSAAYSDIVVNLSPKISALVEASLTYGDLKIDKAHTTTKLKESISAVSSVSEVKIGTAATPQLRIKIKGAYSDVKVK